MIRALSAQESAELAERRSRQIATMTQDVVNAISVLSRWIDAPHTWDETVERRDAAEHCIHQHVNWSKPHDPATMADFERKARERYEAVVDQSNPMHAPYPNWEELTDTLRRRWIDEVSGVR